MSGPFQPGDVVEAVGVRQAGYDPNRFHSRPTGLHRYATVEKVERMPHWDMAGVTLVGVPGVWGEVCFRKIDAADEQFAAQMRACKPQRVRA